MTPSEEFEQVAGPLRRELVAYCYRMTGSANEAEDLAQETYLRAWRSYATFEGRSSLRTWLYRIATNVCLSALGRQGRRPLPSGLSGPETAVAAAGDAAPDVPWLQPFPGPADPGLGDPAAVVAARAGLRLALIAALQYLPARQRAVLILRDVLDWPAAQTAVALGMSATAVNSSLRRARSRLAQAGPAADSIAEPSDRSVRLLASRYAAAFADADIATLVSLLRADVVAEMPPLATWFAGADVVGRFLGTHVLTRPGRFTLVPVVANGQPAFATYERDGSGAGYWRAHAIQVLDLADGRITRITFFLDAGLFPTFGLALTMPGAAVPGAAVPDAGVPDAGVPDAAVPAAPALAPAAGR